MYDSSQYVSSLGTITMVSDGEALTGLWIEGQKYAQAALGDTYREIQEGVGETRYKDVKRDAFDVANKDRDLQIFKDTTRWLDIYFSGKNPDFMPPLKLNGTEFQKEVWEILLAIPYGTTRTYGDIAAQIAKKRNLSRMSAQAVGQAVGHNPISIIVPCHRVVGSNGNLTGYAGGIDKKVKLLELEGIDMDNFFIPEKSSKGE